MLQNLREHAQGWIAGVIAALLALAFGLWGIQYYLSSGQSSDVVAKVNGEKITRQQLNSAYERLRQAYLVSAGSAIELNQAVQKQLKTEALKQVIDREIFAQAASREGFRISANELNAVIMQIPAFQQNGQFSIERYHQVLNSLLFTPEFFLRDLEKTLLVFQRQTAVTESEFALAWETDLFMQLMNQKREISYLIIPANRFLSTVSVSDKEIENYYKEHQEDFRIPEQVSINYIEFTANDVKAKIGVSESDIQQYYQANINNFKNRKLSDVHDQIKNSLERQTLEKLFAEQIDKLTNLIYTNPATLQPAAEAMGLSIKSSELFSAKGGTSGITKNPKIVAAAFSDNVLNQGNNSDPIQIAEGDIVVLRINKHQASTIKPLAEVKPIIESRLKTEKAKEQAMKFGKKLMASLKSGQKLEPLNPAMELVWRAPTEINRKSSGIESGILDQAFAVSPSNNRAGVGGASLANGDFAVVQVLKVIPPNMTSVTEEQRKKAKTEFAQRWGEYMNNLYLMQQRNKAKVHIYQ